MNHRLLPPVERVMVLVASKDGIQADRIEAQLGLQHCPWPYTVHIETRPGWSAASNTLLDRAAEARADVLFMDDDVTLTEETFANWARVEPHAEVVGFGLVDEAGGPAIAPGYQLHSAGLGGFGGRLHDDPAYCAVVTASLMVLRAPVVADPIVRFPIWPGHHFEDLPYCLLAWIGGYRVAFAGGRAIHRVHPTRRVGLARSSDPEFDAKRHQNWMQLSAWWDALSVSNAVAEGLIPLEAPELPR